MSLFIQIHAFAPPHLCRRTRALIGRRNYAYRWIDSTNTPAPRRPAPIKWEWFGPA